MMKILKMMLMDDDDDADEMIVIIQLLLPVLFNADDKAKIYNYISHSPRHCWQHSEVW